MNSRACPLCIDAGYIKCLYRDSVQSDLPVCEDKMAIQDILYFDSTTDSGYNVDHFAWKGVGTEGLPAWKVWRALREPSELRKADPCSRRFDNEMVDITENTLEGQ